MKLVFLLTLLCEETILFVSCFMRMNPASSVLRENDIEWERRQTQPRQSINLKATHSGNAQAAFPEVFNASVHAVAPYVFDSRDDAAATYSVCMTRRRWIADHADGKSATLVGEQAAHLTRVLRVQPGQIFDVVANGFLHRAEVVTADEREVIFTLHEELETESALPVHLLMAVFKFDHMEWGIEKATELGVGRITPVIARRTDKHLAQAAAKRVERWRRIVREAAQQSRRSDVPEVEEPVTLKVALGSVGAKTKLLLAETEEENTLSAGLVGAVDVALAIGPEGGWAPEEMALFSESGWKHVTLGPRILRAETAAIAGLAICGELL